MGPKVSLFFCTNHPRNVFSCKNFPPSPAGGCAGMSNLGFLFAPFPGGIPFFLSNRPRHTILDWSCACAPGYRPSTSNFYLSVFLRCIPLLFTPAHHSAHSCLVVAPVLNIFPSSDSKLPHWAAPLPLQHSIFPRLILVYKIVATGSQVRGLHDSPERISPFSPSRSEEVFPSVAFPSSMERIPSDFFPRSFLIIEPRLLRI